MNATHHTIWIDATPARVFTALLDPQLIPRWRVPAGMRCHVHEFSARPGGRFRISLTYDAPGAAGKSDEHTDTYHGRFEELAPDARVVERLEFETADPQMRGEMRITTHLVPEGGGTRLTALHENLPPGAAPADNEAGWQESLRTYSINSPWFKPWEESGNWIAGVAARPPQLMQGVMDTVGRIWLRSIRSPPDWKSQGVRIDTTKLKVAEGGVRSSTPGAVQEFFEDRMEDFETALEIADLEKRSLVTSTFFRGPPVVLLNFPFAYRGERDADGVYAVRVYRMKESQ